MAHRGSTVTVKRRSATGEIKTINVPAHMLTNYEKRGWEKASEAPAPVEAKKAKPKKETAETDFGHVDTAQH